MNVKYDYNLFYIYDTFQDVGVNRKRYNFSVSSWATSSSWLESGESKKEKEHIKLQSWHYLDDRLAS